MHLPTLLLLLPACALVQAPERVAPDVLATPRNETFPAIDPRTGDLWFSVYDRSFDAQTLMVARKSGETWVAATTAPFSGTHGDRAPRFSPDGRFLYFTSNRPVTGRQTGDLNIWVVERTEAGWASLRTAPTERTAPRSCGPRRRHPRCQARRG
jgi:Tol biopolymer transport system component